VLGSAFIAPAQGLEEWVDVFQNRGVWCGTVTREIVSRLGEIYCGGERGLMGEIAELIERYAPRHTARRQEVAQSLSGLACAKVSTRTRWFEAPPPLVSFLARSFSIENELFASPTDRCPHIPHYWSMFNADSAFGANYNAFSAAWTGANYMCPDFTSACLYKACRWALESIDRNNCCKVYEGLN
jgi:hypothetical protein